VRKPGNVSKAFREHWGERTVAAAARKALDTMIPGSSASSTPIDVEVLARYIGIAQVVEVEMADHDGLLSITPAGTYVATIRRGQSLTRRRFTLAHEVGHLIVFRSLGRRDVANLISCAVNSLDEKDEEHLCDTLAAELLMPRDQYLQTMRDVGVDASTVSAIAQRYAVSLPAASRRIAELEPYDIGFGVWIRDTNGRLLPKWYLTKKGPASSEYPIDSDQPGFACFTETRVRGWRWFSLRGRTDKFFVDICPIVRGPTRSWMVLIIFEQAAEHIISSISKPVAHDSAGQLPLTDE
jgi:Zn-dependent peptidase ImmA (M78 family)